MNYLFFPLAIEHPDFSAADLEAEFEQMRFRNQVIEACLTGELDSAFVLEVLDAHSVPVEQYVQEIAEGIEILIAS